MYLTSLIVPTCDRRRLLRTSGLVAAAALLSVAAPPARAQAQGLRSTAGPYELEVLVGGSPAPTFSHGGSSYVLGQPGERYILRVWNRTGARIEAVVTVDGRDVIDGKLGDFRRKRGYMVNAGGFVDIDGWRISRKQVAAFRFTSVANSYAGLTGNARNVGVIGVAVFPERVYLPPPPPRPIYPVDPVRSERAPSAAPSSAPRALEGEAGAGKQAAAPAQRPGLGTGFGESVTSHIREVEFVRANPTAPAVVLGLRYNDRQGLLALGIDVDGPSYETDDVWLRGTADPFPTAQGQYTAPPPGWRR